MDSTLCFNAIMFLSILLSMLKNVNPFNPDFLIIFHLKSNDSKWSHWGWKGYTSSII